jgi:serine/threonine protein kinase/Tol biopolymer transport system component
MNRSAWKRAKSLLADAAELPAADRERFVAEHCSDPELRRDVLELLASPASLTGIVAASALQPGARLGPYVIGRLIGSGGMGEVYKAHDSTLNRSVAIKVLPEPLSDDAERLARFRREAQLLAAFNHPNIAHIHGFEEFAGVATLVMELVDGPTLADRIAHGAIPLPEALPIAKQIADALDAAHQQGIVHRDLKPANVKVREDGTVKVLDFGLARALEPTTPSGADTIRSPSPGHTQPGLVIGTPAYMAPEQALGKAVDKRADIWSFGCVLYEMLTARRAFESNEVADTLSQVIGKDPDWTALPSNTPAPILRVLRQCLHKDRNRRLADIADARLDIEEALTPSADASAVIVRDRVEPPAKWPRVLPWIVAAASGGALAIVLVFGSPWRKPPVFAPLRLSANLGAGTAVVDFATGSSLALSPDGTELAFLGSKRSEGIPRLYVRRLEHSEAVLLPETDGADGPFFSPDGQWLAFFSSGKLKKISVTGGAAITLCDAPNGRGGSWGEDGIIVFSPERQTILWRVSSAGGAPQPLTTLDAGELTQRWPQILPGGRAVLYSSLSPVGDFDFDKGNLVVQPLPTGMRKVVVRGAYYGRYVPSGHLVYLHNGTLFAAAFDPDRLEVTGPPFPVADSVATNTTGGAGLFAVSNSGALVYAPGGSGSDESPIAWLDRSGKSSVLRSAPSNWANLRFAPDGRRIAIDMWDGKQWDIWVDDWARGALARLTTSNSHSSGPVWTPDGRRIAFASQRGEKAVAMTFNLYWQRADGSGEAQRLTTSENQQVPGSWHPSGKVLAFEERSSHLSVMLLPMEGDDASGWKPGKPTVFLSGAFDVRAPAFSPDGRWLAYESRQSGQYNVYVRPFPGPGSQLPISTGGGVFPTWSRTRHELLYSTLDQRVMAVNYSVEGDSFHAEQPRPWPEARYKSGGISRPVPSRGFDLHPDGNRLALAKVGETEPAMKWDRLEIILNFSDELRRIAPVQRH